MGHVIDLAKERHLSVIKQKLSEIYINNKIKLYESQGRLSELSYDEYFRYIKMKQKEGYIYFLYEDKTFNSIIFGKMGHGVSVHYSFTKDGVYKGRGENSCPLGRCIENIRLIDEKEFREEWRTNLKFNERYLEELINLKSISNRLLELIFKDPETNEMILEGICNEDIIKYRIYDLLIEPFIIKRKSLLD